jgi:hypothetical protein
MKAILVDLDSRGTKMDFDTFAFVGLKYWDGVPILTVIKRVAKPEEGMRILASLTELSSDLASELHADMCTAIEEADQVEKSKIDKKARRHRSIPKAPPDSDQKPGGTLENSPGLNKS